MSKVLCQRCGKYFDDHSLFFADTNCTLCKSILREKEDESDRRMREKEDDRERKKEDESNRRMQKLLDEVAEQESDREEFDRYCKKLEEELAKEEGKQNQVMIRYYFKKIGASESELESMGFK